MAIVISESDIFHNTFAIRNEKGCCGTCFVVTLEGVSVIITAAHIFHEIKHKIKSNFFIFKADNWIELEGVPYVISEVTKFSMIDILIIKSQSVIKDNPVPAVRFDNKVELGSDVYVLGFPLFDELRSDLYKSDKSNDNFPYPFASRGMIAKIDFPYLYLDGHLNSGCSGGVVVSLVNETNELEIIGVYTSHKDLKGYVGYTTYEKIENAHIGKVSNVSALDEVVRDPDFIGFLNEK